MLLIFLAICTLHKLALSSKAELIGQDQIPPRQSPFSDLRVRASTRLSASSTVTSSIIARCPVEADHDASLSGLLRVIDEDEILTESSR